MKKLIVGEGKLIFSAIVARRFKPLASLTSFFVDWLLVG